MAIVKRIRDNSGSGKEFESVTTSEVTYDTTPQVGSFNPVVSDGIAKAIAGGGNVPAPSEEDNGKVLTVVDGAAAWAPAQGGGSSYTAGDGIAITNNEIKVRVKDGGGLAFSESSTGGEDMELVLPVGTVSEEGWKSLVDSNGELIRAEYDEDHNVTAITFRYLWNGSDSNPLAIANVAHDDTKSYNAKLHLLQPHPKDSYTEIIATSDTLSDAFTAGWYSWDTEHEEAAIYSLGTPVETTDSGTVYEVSFTVPGEHVDDFSTMAFSASGTDMSNVADVVQSSFLSEDYVFMLNADYVHIAGSETIPGGDLYVEVDQTYDAWSSKPQSGVAVAEAIQQAIPPIPAVKSNGEMIGHSRSGSGQITEDPSTFTLAYTNSGDAADNQFQLQEYINANNRVCTLYGRCTLNGQESATNGADTTGTVTVTATDSSTVTFTIKLRQYAYQYSDYGQNKTQVSFTSEPFCFPIENCWTNSEGGSYDYVSAISVNIAGTNSGSETLDKARLDIVASWTDGNIPK